MTFLKVGKVLVLATVFFLSSSAFGKKAPLITIACSSFGGEQELCDTAAHAWAKKAGARIQLFSTPNNSNDRLALFQQLLVGKTASFDVLLIDVIWPGLLDRYLIDLRPYIPQQNFILFQNIGAKFSIMVLIQHLALRFCWTARADGERGLGDEKKHDK